ncbi:MAG: hypothetical protein ABSE73_17420 [Planctomycetota bacterium]
MGSHWPLVVAGGMIALAVSLGMYQHDLAANAATASKKAEVPPFANKDSGKAATPERPPAPSGTALTAEEPLAPEGNAAVAPEAVQAPAPTVPPNAALAQKIELATARPFGPGPAKPGALAPEPLNQAAKQEQNKAVLAGLRALLQEKLGVVPANLAVAGAYTIGMEGVRLDVNPGANWSIGLYNFNAKNPEEETPNFKRCMEAVASSLDIDMTKKAVKADNGKSYLKTTCKLGNISMVFDPANNKWTISPLGQAAQDAALIRPKGNEQVIPAPPKKQGPPVAPPRPPAKDDVF